VYIPRPVGRRFITALAVAASTFAATPVLAAPATTEPVDEVGDDTPGDDGDEPPTSSGEPEVSSEDVAAMKAEVESLREEVEALRTSQAEIAAKVGAPPPRPAADPAETPARPPPRQSGPGDAAFNRPPDYADGFHFGSYGRVIAAGDHRGRAGRDGDIVARGSRLDESTYAELELRREDYWKETGAYTRIVATLAVAAPVFHYSGVFDIEMGLRNLYIEESGLGLDKLRIWAGSRMYRGDDVYLLDFWPLDNLNTLGGGVAYTFLKDLDVKLHAGVNQPQHPLFYQQVARPAPLGQTGERPVTVLDRQKVISSAKVSNIFYLGDRGAGIKPVVYGEMHYGNEGQRETEPRQFETVPADYGWLVGTQIGAFTGKRSTHLNLVFRYAAGLAAYGQFNAPTQLSPQRTSASARELLAAIGGNYEVGPFGLLLGGYLRSFRNASPDLDFDDLGEGVIIARPTVWFGKIAGLSVEGSYQAQRRGVLVASGDGSARPQFGQLGRVGFVPFLTPAGRGNFARPHIRFIYLLSVRDDGARRLYPEHDVFGLRPVDHFIGFGAEWWFGSTSYFRD
jgi:maltoporin